MSCNNCPPPDSKHTKEPKPSSDDSSLSARALQLTSAILPEGLALLSCSCCWLPTLVDFIFAGSVTTAAVPGIQNLRHVFLIISVLSLAWGIWREGLSRRMIRRAVISGGMVAWGHYSKRAEAAGGHHGHHSCH